MRQYRNEWKYCCGEGTLAALETRLGALLEADENSGKNGVYTVHSLYFDDYRCSCASDTEAGLSKRFKYRIRYYGDDARFIRLERKEKLYGRCRKESCLLTPEQYEKITSGDCADFIYEFPDTLLARFCTDILTYGFEPKVIIDYERTAFTELAANVRVTIDRNISASKDTENFLTRDYLAIPIQQKARHILEVKFDGILPSYIRRIISDRELSQTSFSKYYYGLCAVKRR
ncbi:MAG: polyphosphate polymerase domain-containing protein [Clostridia bacterium]|nr:polyphosphate polymerase domain-containing protein [Clostridia bacterium]